MNYFPNGDEEKNLIKFIAKFQYLKVSDAKYFFTSKKYYRNRISNLISKRFLKKIKLNLVLDELGIEYSKLFQFEYNILNRDKRYIPRLLYMSNLGAYFFSEKTIAFTPSFSIKDKEVFTTTARKFIGILHINGFNYLTYHIPGESSKKYLTSVIYDIQKERKYKNILVLADNINQVKIDDFIFGLNKVLLVEESEDNREKLKYIHSMNWDRVIEKFYKNKVYFAEYNFCDYTDYKDKYVSTFYFFDTEKINRIKQFLRENKNKNAEIICSDDLEDKIKKELPNARYITINLEEYIDKERNYYE